MFQLVTWFDATARMSYFDCTRFRSPLIPSPVSVEVKSIKNPSFFALVELRKLQHTNKGNKTKIAKRTEKDITRMKTSIV